MKKIGIIGCGKIAQIRHLPEYAENKAAILTGYYDFNEQRAADIANRYGGKAYASVDALLNDGEIDAVSVCAANNAHAEITIKALNAGKHVLCEKPMATTLEECEAMVAAAKRNSRYLMIGQHQRLTGTHGKARELLKQGLIGNVLTFRTTFGHSGPENWSIDPGKSSWFFDKQRAAMGVMADLGIHKTDLIQFLMEDRIIETTARIVTLDKRDENGNLVTVDDNAFCIYKMRSGAMGTMTASWTYYGKEDNSTVIYGSEGIMKIYDNPAHSIEVITKTGDRIIFDIDRIQENDKQTKSGVIDAFVASIVEGKEPPISGEDVLSAMRVIFASFESSERNETVQIKENVI